MEANYIVKTIGYGISKYKIEFIDCWTVLKPKD